MYAWYDSLVEPNRFFVLLGVVMILMVGINVPYALANILSWTVLLLMLVTRAIQIHSKKS